MFTLVDLYPDEVLHHYFYLHPCWYYYDDFLPQYIHATRIQ